MRLIGSSAALAACVAVAACGGGDGEGTKTQAQVPDAQRAEKATLTVVEKCNAIRLNGNGDTSQVSSAVDVLIQEFRKDPDSKLAATDLKAETMREVLEFARGSLADCSQADAERLSDQLASSAPSEDSAGAPAEEDGESTSQADPAAFGEAVKGTGSPVMRVEVEESGRVAVYLAMGEKTNPGTTTSICEAIAAVDPEALAAIYEDGSFIAATCGTIKTP